MEAVGRVKGVLGARPVFDAHVDALQRALDLGHDLGRRTPGQFDLERAAQGGLGAVVLVSWVDPGYMPVGAGARARALMGAGRELAERWPERLVLVGNGEELAEARRAERIAGILGIEGGHALEEDLGALEGFFADGLRVLTLVWNNHLSWIRSCQEGAGAGVPAGLSPFGREVVRRMNQLGVLVDLSHASERALFDALEVAERPAIASHSGCRALHDHPRNLSDEALRALGERGGVVGIVFHPGFLDADARAEENRVRGTAAYRALGDEEVAGLAGGTRLFLRQSGHMRARARPLPAERLIEHVLHALEVAGPHAVGLGSDYDGILRAPVGLEDARGYGRIAELLLARGVDEETVLGVLGGNMERAFAAATRGAPSVSAAGSAVGG